jgi:hypothetical protein
MAFPDTKRRKPHTWTLVRGAWQEIRIRYGRDDKSEGGAFGRHSLVDNRTAGPSTALRFGRDDKS